LEYPCRPPLEDHVHWTTPAGAQVLINGIWYYPNFFYLNSYWETRKAKRGRIRFSGQARNKQLSNMATEMILRRMNIQDATVYGFRSSFRDWAGNVSNFPRESPRQLWRTSSVTKPSKHIAEGTHWRSAASLWRRGPHTANPSALRRLCRFVGVHRSELELGSSRARNGLEISYRSRPNQA
jgi:hypothetical protein